MNQVEAQLVGVPEPAEVVIENIGFLALNGETKVKLFPKGFEPDSLPLPSSSLFALANLIFGTTQSLRDAFAGGPEKIIPYNSQVLVSLPTDISHVAFTADESHLVLGLSAGGLAIYSVQDLATGGRDSKAVLELATDGGLREVKPNPMAPELVAIVTVGGEVRMANLNTRGWESNSNGNVALKTGVSTVSWSRRGKQIVCGMGDGTGWQMTPQGEGKATLPSVPGLENHFVSSIVWLENDLFITTHTPVPSGETNNDSVFHVLVRSETFKYTPLPDPVTPFGMDSRAPPYFFHATIKDYAPSIRDTIIFTNTCSSDVGLVSRFSTAIANDQSVPADTWITVNIGEDTRRAQMPLSDESMSDTSPIGMALDLSSKVNVVRPVGGEEIEESPGPLPILMVLNHEGLLSAWNVIYNDAIVKGERYSGMAIYASNEGQPQPAAPQTPQQPPSRSQTTQATPSAAPFGASPFGGNGAYGQSPAPGNGSAFGQPPNAASSTPFGKPASSAFGQTSALHSPQPSGQAFGTGNGLSAFGKPSALGGSMWGSTPGVPASTTTQSPGATFGQPSVFGQPSALSSATSAPSFGAPTQLGAKMPSAAGFGKPSPLGGTPAGGSVFGGGSAFGSGSVFGANAKPGFSAISANSGSTPVWATGKSSSVESAPSAFGSNPNPKVSGAFGLRDNEQFKIHSAFKPDSPVPVTGGGGQPSSGGSFGNFGMGLGDALSATPSAAATSAAPRSLPTSLPTPGRATDQGIRDANMDDSDAQADEPSDDEDDIIPPGAARSRVTGFAQTPPTNSTLPKGIFSSTKAAASNSFGSSPFANRSPSAFASVTNSPGVSPFGPFANQTTTSFPALSTPSTPPPPPKSPFANPRGLLSPFGALQTASPQPLKKVENPQQTPTPTPAFPKTPPPPSPPAPLPLSRPRIPSPPPLPSDLLPPPSASSRREPENLPGASADDAPSTSEATSGDAAAPKLPDSSGSSFSEEDSPAPLPPDFTSAPKLKEPRVELPSLPDSGSDETGENEQVDGSEDGSPGDEADEAGDEAGEDEDEDEGEDEDEDEGEGEGDEGGSAREGEVEGEGEGEGEKIDDRVPPASQPLSSLDLTSMPKPPSKPTNQNSIFQAGTSFRDTFGEGTDGTTLFSNLAQHASSSKSESDTGSASDGESLSLQLKGRTLSTAPASGNRRTSISDKPMGRKSLVLGGVGRRSKPADSGRTSTVPAASSRLRPSGPPPQHSSPRMASKAPQRSSSPSPSPKPKQGLEIGEEEVEEEVEEAEVEEEVVEVEEEESDLDLDKDYDGYDPDRVQKKLERGIMKPVQELPKFRRNGEVEVSNDFDAVFDSIYLSGTMMVNRIGLTVRGLKAYHQSQEIPVPDVEHEGAKDMKQTQDWKLCELDKVRIILSELLEEVKCENKGNGELEVSYEAANKGFIKLDTKDVEIKRLLAIHNDAQAVAIARARPLAPEQVLQQRKLRKEYARVEKLLRDSEKEVTLLKAIIASQGKDKPGLVVPPTVDAVRSTILKLTGMVRRRGGDIDVLEERLRQLKVRRSRSTSATPGRGTTPDRTIRGGTPQRFLTPERPRGYELGVPATGHMSPGLAVWTDPLDVEEAKEEKRAAKAVGKKLRDALEQRGSKLTTPGK